MALIELFAIDRRCLEAISRNIKRRAYAYVNHPDFEAGEVYLTFVLGSGGDLRALKIIEEKRK